MASVKLALAELTLEDKIQLATSIGSSLIVNEIIESARGPSILGNAAEEN